jgi:hypothetical protein
VLEVRSTPELAPLVASWVPHFAPEPAARGPVRLRMRVEAGRPELDPPAAPPRLAVRNARGWCLPDGRVLLCEPGGRVSAVVDPAAGEARVRLAIPAQDQEELGPEVFGVLMLCAGLLLGRSCRTLVHAGGVLAPDGRAWLLCGGPFSGKTSSCVGLVRAGWDYLADDYVVLGRAGQNGLEVEGWPRRFNLDVGYRAGSSQGVRRRVEPSAFGPGRWRSRAVLGGLLFPRVEADAPTSATPITAMDALAGLLPQSPWLAADAPAAPGLLGLLREASGLPAYALSLGRDCYEDPAPLARLIGEITAGSSRT